MSKSCPVNTNSPEQPPVQKPMGSPIRGKIRAFYDELANIGGVVSTKAEFEARMSENFITKVAGIAHLPVLTKYSKLENILSAWFGVRSYLWNAASLKMTQAGDVSKLLLDQSRLASNMVEMMATYKSIPSIRKLYGELQKALPEIDKPTLQALLHDHIVIGQFPKLTNVYDSPVVRAQLQQRYFAHMRKLKDLGIADTDISKLDELSGEISANLDNARMLVGKFGLDVKQLQNGGYFPLKANDEIKRFFDRIDERAFGQRGKREFDTAGVLNNSRTSAIPGVLDLDKTADVLGMTVDDLVDKMAVPGEISRHLREKFTPDELEKLYNNGTLIQIPALSDELTAFFSEALDLPLQNLGEAIVLDPVQALKTYNNQLKNAVENASMMQTALNEGVKQGWILDEFAVKKLPNTKDYVRIGTNKLFADLFHSSKLRDELSDAYMHRTVANQLNALFVANTSFEQLGAIGAALQASIKYTGFIKKGFLLATGGLPYITRVNVQNLISLNAATGSRGIFHYAQGLADVTRVIKDKSLYSLSNSLKFTIGNESLSLRGLYERTFLLRNTSFASGVGEKVDKGGWDRLTKWDKATRDRFLRFQEIYHERYGSPITGKMGDYASMVAEMGNAGYQAAYEQLAAVNQFLDFAARWTAVRTLAANPKYAGREAWESFDELLRYTDEYFNINDNAGLIGKAAGQLFIPFASFAMVAPGSMLRHAMRNPARYGRMMALYSQAQHSQGSQFTDAELRQWQKDSYPLFLGRNSEGNIWSINPGTVDFYLDTSVWLKENFEKVARANGANMGSVAEIADSKLNPEADLYKSMQDFFNRFYVSKPLLAAFANIDTQTGEQFSKVEQTDTLLGFETNKRTRAFITGLLPFLNSIDRKLPSAITGAPAKYSGDGLTVEKQAIPSWTGAIPNTGGGRQRSDIAEVLPWVTENAFGLTLSEFDPEANVISNYKDFGKRISDIDGALSSIDRTLTTQPERTDREDLLLQRRRLQQIKGMLQYNKILADTLAIRKGYSPPTAVEAIRSKQTSVMDVQGEALLEFLGQQRQ